MQFLGSCYYCVFLIFILFMPIGDAAGVIPPGYFNCFTINDTVTYNATRISNETAEWLIRGRKPKSTNKMPEAPKELSSKMEGNAPVIRWETRPILLYGLKYLRHILLKIVQSYTNKNGTFEETDYILLNVSGKDAMTRYSYNCSELKPGAYEVSAKLWFIGKLQQSSNGHLLADVDELSESNTHLIPRHDIISTLKAIKNVTETCICSSRITVIRLRITSYSTETVVGVTTQIQAVGLPNDTKVEIQLIQDKDRSTQLLTESLNVQGQQLQRPEPYIKTFNVSRGNGYYIRVKRHCQRKYKGVLSCGKDEADVNRSETVFIESVETGLFHPPISPSIEDLEGIDIYQVLQMAAVTFAFGICILVEMALIITIFTAIFCPQKKLSSFYKRSTYVKLDNKGQIATKLITSKRVAIIYTKDSCKHEERVKRINDELRKRGIESVLFDETTSPEMRANCIDAAENVVTSFGVIIFVISPTLYNICKKEETLLHSVKEETNEVGVQILTRFLAVVLQTLKVKTVWADANKAKLISICVAETKHEYKQLSLKMRREHPLLFKDKIYFDSLRHVDDSSIRKQIENVIHLLKRSR